MTAIQAKKTLASAQSRFMQAVSQGIEQLMQQCGYSRERATAALLRELGRGDVAPNDQEVFDSMTTFGLGIDEASHALTVSRAVKRAMKERGLSAVEAIEDLSTKLNISNLVTSGEPQEDEQAVVNTSRPSSPQQQRPAPATTLAPSDRTSTSSLQRKRKATAKPSTHHKNAKQKKNPSRKRPAPPNEKFSRERADSVTEAVEAKAKKARLSPEDSPSPTDNADAAAPIIVRKRSSTTHRNADQSQDSQSV